ncbi:hypothetical protein ASPVEDRAFT_55428 [Aspergillus versicolor CBS 583.65]|uniref:Glucuronyl hydrolase n=1 Tax=Aspergillus versicolor CBS 583.65 TaxID=1036611 RepID=A0A1L9PVV0_ASPVE|nr:uncharacterized protein ASPVEDRAFT_55428 [Aspergillus versicolor CBS 583.65]OJJ05562.1 hypothetical protein ASPVEDRAFT_55428 [Aspergillus versicolor CBS 583.65]
MSAESDFLLEVFSENVVAKVLRVATEALNNNNPPTVYPEFVPQHEGTGRYVLRDADFWTCGFFPGLLYLLRERAVKYPQAFMNRSASSRTAFLDELTQLCNIWTSPIRAMTTRTDTHDLGFMLQPSLRRDWELTGNASSLDGIITGARSLASRFVPGVGAIRSWDALVQSDVNITSLEDDCLVIVDSMMNLDLLYYASHHVAEPGLADIATKHARTVIRSLLRRESRDEVEGPLYSTYHVANFDPRTGGIKEHRTAQGYSKDSTWVRGQAWAITGFAQTYTWTKEREFLAVACGLAEYFILRLEGSPACVERPAPTEDDPRRTVGRYVPLWDFDAPVEDENSPLRDSSAGVIAANGMFVLSAALGADGQGVLAERYRSIAVRIVAETIEYSLSREKARLVGLTVEDELPGERFDAILKNATANHNSKDHHRYSDHGLVYADYYLLEFGNRLLGMGW